MHAVILKNISIDLLLVDQYFLESLSSASIGSLNISDHAPISPVPLSQDAGQWTWYLNENLLDDAVALKQVYGTISLYFVENLPGGVTGIVSVWEGHKALVRGGIDFPGLQAKEST